MRLHPFLLLLVPPLPLSNLWRSTTLQLIQIFDQGHITGHRTLLQRTYTLENPPRLIMSIVARRGSNVGSFHQTQAVRTALMEHVGISGVRTRTMVNEPQEVVDQANTLLDQIPMRVGTSMLAGIVFFPEWIARPLGISTWL